ncbi:Uncharacterised protein [uncultured archaeon]|nr:Uncharacterised protein [uncultured archaeon]
MSDPKQKPIDPNLIHAAGGAPAEAPKPKEPTHEEILTRLTAGASARKILSERIVEQASEQIAALEKRKNDIASAAEIERDKALGETEQTKKEKEEFLHDRRQEDLDRLHTKVKEGKNDLQAQFGTLAANSSGLSATELAEKTKEIDDVGVKADADIEEEHAANMKAAAEEAAAETLEAERNYEANKSIIKAIDAEIEAVKKEKEVRLKELWSTKLDEKVAEADGVCLGQIGPPESSYAKVEKTAISPGVRNAAIATVVGVGLYFGLNQMSPAPKFFQPPPKLFISTDTVSNIRVMPLASTGLAGVGKPVAQAPKTAAAAKPSVAAAKPVKKAAPAAKAKGGARAMITDRTLINCASSIHAARAELKRFNDNGTIFQKSPKESVRLFCDEASTRIQSMSREQRAAATELMFAVANAKKAGALGQDDWEATALNKIRKGGMKAGDMKALSKKLRAAIKERKSHLATPKAAKPAVAKPAKKAVVAAVKPVAAKAEKGVQTEPLMKNATSQAIEGQLEDSVSKAMKAGYLGQ